MRALYIHISGLVGLLVFLREVLNYAPIERTILVAATTGLTVYLMLIVGHSIVQRIMAYSPPAPTKDSSQEAARGSVPGHNAATDNAATRNTPPASTNVSPAVEPSEDQPASERTEASPATESNEPTPDRTSNADRQGSDPSESLAQTTV